MTLSLQMLRFYRGCESATGGVICVMAIFSPWAFGTTQNWSIWVMNAGSYILGVLLAAKLFIRWSTGYVPPTWERRSSSGRPLVRALALITVILVVYCFISACNNRAVYDRSSASLRYEQFIAWLPHSYDSTTSWQASFKYLALGLAFWAARDWFLGKTTYEERLERGHLGDPRGRRASVIPERLRLFLIVLTINGGLLGIECLLQRLDGTSRLLFFEPTHMNREAVAQFGPYAYRSNAAQYFNLLWPLALGVWWSLERAARRGASGVDIFGMRSRHLLLLCVFIMASCPLVATSRVGVVVGLVNLIVAAVITWFAQGKSDTKSKMSIALCLAAVLGFSAMTGWSDIAPRFESANFDDSLQVRNQMYDMARPMADDSPVFGTGPGTFEPLFQLFRPDPEEYWPAQLHNDWLETLITFGWMGVLLIAAALALVLAHWFVARAIYATNHLAVLCWASLAGCLFYARYDFPFQIYSVLFLFLMICAALFSFSHQR